MKKVKKTVPKKVKTEKNSVSKIFVGIIGIILGIIYLAKNTGLIPIEFSFEIYDLWPLVIIFTGLLLLKGKWISIIIGTVITALIFGVFGFMMFGTYYSSDKTANNIPIIVEKGNNIKSASITINSEKGDITISGESKNLMEGTLSTNSTEQIISEKTENKIQKVTLDLTEKEMGLFDRKINILSLFLNSKAPLNIYLNNSLSHMNLDFRAIKAESIEINTKTSNLDLKIGDKTDKSSLKIDAKTSSIDINLPKTVGINLTLETTLSSKAMTDFMEVGENVYQSANYKTAEKFIDIYLNLSMSNLNIEWAQ
jgi:hypothetical protein